MNAASPTGARLKLVLLAVLFFAPVIGAIAIFFYAPEWFSGRVNNGTLVSPARAVPDLVLTDAAGAPMPGALRDKWSLVYLAGASCDERCSARLVLARQVRLALNQNRGRVQRVYLAPDSAAELARGKYIFGATGGCGCHTQPKQSVNSGGRKYDGPFGTVYSSNITPDPKTGIGSWTDAQIITAIRLGRRPNGERLLPVHPYTVFNGMAEGDLTGALEHYQAVLQGGTPGDSLSVRAQHRMNALGRAEPSQP